MKTAFLKVVFHLAVLALFLILFILWMLLLQVLLPDRTAASGHYHANGFGVLLMAFGVIMALLIADRCGSLVFKSAGLSGDERWSIMKRRSRF
jgi:hypothetical protein